MIWIHHTRGCDKNLTECFFSVNWGQVCLSAWHIQPDRIFSRMKKVTGDMNQWAHSSSSQLVLSTDSQVTAFSRSHHLRFVLCFTKTFIRFWRRYQLLVFGHRGSLECCFVYLFIFFTKECTYWKDGFISYISLKNYTTNALILLLHQPFCTRSSDQRFYYVVLTLNNIRLKELQLNFCPAKGVPHCALRRLSNPTYTLYTQWLTGQYLFIYTDESHVKPIFTPLFDFLSTWK